MTREDAKPDREATGSPLGATLSGSEPRPVETVGSQWVNTKSMARALGCCRNTLGNMKRSGILKEGRHWRRVNPAAPRSTLVWHLARTLAALGAL